MPRNSQLHSTPQSHSSSISEELDDQEGVSTDDDETYASDEKESGDERPTKRWRSSEPPEEIFSEVEQEKEWTCEIIGEHVDHSGNVMLEVRWDDWARADGTKTTWHHVSDGNINSDTWNRTQQSLRRDMAKESLEINVISTVDIHNTETYLRSQAFIEKLKLSRSSPPNLMLELSRRQARQQDVTQAGTSSIEHQGSSLSSYPLRNNQRASTRQKTEISLANSSSSRGSSKYSSRSSMKTNSSSDMLITSKSTPFSSPTSESTTSRLNTPHNFLTSPNRTDKGKNRQITSHVKEEEISEALTPAALRSQLQKSWTRIAAREKAAPIYFANTVDAEPVPPLSLDFVYLESRYNFAPGATDLSQMEDFLVKCTSKTCHVAAACECQQASALVNERGVPQRAYTPEGLFAFNVPKGTEVVECNKLCECSLKSCQNRVSQRPRDIPIEIVKTTSRGWGVRSLVDVKKGKVLGLYTGLVMPRDVARSDPNHADSEYMFDLDGDESDENFPVHHALYSVDSKSCGNWTRFINHSCSPTLGIYLVVHDIPPANGLPFIAFVARKDLPARTEFTVDYDPRAAERLLTAKEGKKQVAQASSESNVNGRRSCKCGSENCRGFLS